jgi:hypothetical protein
LTYNNNQAGKIYRASQPVENLIKATEIPSCITDPTLEICKTIEIKKTKSPLSDQFLFSQVNTKNLVTDDIFSL